MLGEEHSLLEDESKESKTSSGLLAGEIGWY